MLPRRHYLSARLHSHTCVTATQTETEHSRQLQGSRGPSHLPPGAATRTPTAPGNRPVLSVLPLEPGGGLCVWGFFPGSSETRPLYGVGPQLHCFTSRSYSTDKHSAVRLQRHRTDSWAVPTSGRQGQAPPPTFPSGPWWTKAITCLEELRQQEMRGPRVDTHFPFFKAQQLPEVASPPGTASGVGAPAHLCPSGSPGRAGGGLAPQLSPLCLC